MTDHSLGRNADGGGLRSLSPRGVRRFWLTILFSGWEVARGRETALSLGDGVARDGAFTSRRGPGEGLFRFARDFGRLGIRISLTRACPRAWWELLDVEFRFTGISMSHTQTEMPTIALSLEICVKTRFAGHSEESRSDRDEEESRIVFKVLRARFLSVG